MGPSPDDERTGARGLFRYALAATNTCNLARRGLLKLLRRFVPILRRGEYVVVLRWDDVRSVLERPEDFSVRIFAMRMKETTGITFLGMDPSPAYEHEAGALRAALQVPDPRPRRDGAREPDDLGRLSEVRRFAAELARRQVEEAQKRSRDGEIDVVRDLADVVPLTFAREFFGTPEPHPPALLYWFKSISYYVFAGRPYAWAAAAQTSGRRAASHFLDLVRERKQAIAAGRSTPDDVLGRLLAGQNAPGGLADDAIARSLSFISGAMMPTSWLFIEAVDRLVRLGRAQRELLHRHAVEGDRAAVRAYVVEAARFFPFPFEIIRYCEREAEIAGKRITPGTLVRLLIGSAQLDPRAVPAPERFVPGRPESQYMLFGHHVHLCMGKDIAEELMTEMAMALFSCVNLRRAPGPRGYIRYLRDTKSIPYGPYPASFVLRTDV